MIKRILVGIDTSEHARTAQTYAFHLARRLHATLIGVHVVDIVSIEGSFFHDISGSLGLEPYLDFSTKMREVLNARGKAVLEDFAHAARREAIPAETVLDVGVVANQLCERAKSVDLLGSRTPLKFRASNGGILIQLPDLPEDLRQQPAWVLRISQ